MRRNSPLIYLVAGVLTLFAWCLDAAKQNRPVLIFDAIVDLVTMYPGKDLKYVTVRAVRSEYGFYEFERLSNGRNLGCLGESCFLITEAGKPLSEGFYEIVPVDNGYRASIDDKCYSLDQHGARRYRSEVHDPDGPFIYPDRLKRRSDSF